jgi:hypothetical protein
MDAAWERHGMCGLALTVTLSDERNIGLAAYIPYLATLFFFTSFNSCGRDAYVTTAKTL